MRRLFVLLLLAAPAAAQAPAPADRDKQLLAEIADKSEQLKNLKYLSDVIGPRLTGSANLERANKWAAEKMKEYGLTNVKLEPWEVPVGWERGTAEMKLVLPTEKKLTVASAGWAPGTKGRITGEVVFLDIKTKADLEKYRGKLRNAIVMTSPPPVVAPVTDTSYGPGGGARRPQAPMPTPAAGEKKDEKKEAPKEQPPAAPARRGFGELQALQRELGDFFRTEGVAATLRDSNKPHGLLVTTGGWRGEETRETPTAGPASLFIAHEDYSLLYRLVTEHKLTTVCEISVTNSFTSGPVTVYNTVGEIVGTEKPDEIVVVGAHLDSWDLATGTTDNGTGTSVVLEVARTFGVLAKKGIKPKRTVRFVLFSGEEQGLHGSKQYVKRHEAELPKHSMAVVHDTGTGKVLSLGLQGRDAVQKILAPELDALKAVGFEGVTLAGSGGTDHLSFEAKGVPGFACKQDMDEYRFTHHTQSDTFDKAKGPSLIQGAQVLAVTAMRAANLKDLLPRTREERPKKDTEE